MSTLQHILLYYLIFQDNIFILYTGIVNVTNYFCFFIVTYIIIIYTKFRKKICIHIYNNFDS